LRATSCFDIFDDAACRQPSLCYMFIFFFHYIAADFAFCALMFAARALYVYADLRVS